MSSSPQLPSPQVSGVNVFRHLSLVTQEINRAQSVAGVGIPSMLREFYNEHEVSVVGTSSIAGKADIVCS